MTLIAEQIKLQRVYSNGLNSIILLLDTNQIYSIFVSNMINIFDEQLNKEEFRNNILTIFYSLVYLSNFVLENKEKVLDPISKLSKLLKKIKFNYEITNNGIKIIIKFKDYFKGYLYNQSNDTYLNEFNLNCFFISKANYLFENDDRIIVNTKKNITDIEENGKIDAKFNIQLKGNKSQKTYTILINGDLYDSLEQGISILNYCLHIKNENMENNENILRLNVSFKTKQVSEKQNYHI